MKWEEELLMEVSERDWEQILYALKVIKPLISYFGENLPGK